jgi:membrane protease YdiL (CAAX protease family)
MNGVGLVIASFQATLEFLPISHIRAEVVGQLGYALGYLLIFMLPAAVLKHLLQKRGLIYRPMHADFRVSGSLPILILGGVCLIWVQTYLNAAMVGVFHYAEFSNEVFWETDQLKYGYQIVLQFIVTALVPAFCEEFLFRGVFLTNLIPFGKNNAILISALLFSLMHENPAQALFAFVAGILLGLIYIKTGSIWNCIIVHLINNFVSLLESIINYNFNTSAIWALPLLDVLIYVVGAISLAVLIYVFFSKHPRYDDGMYQKELPAADSYAVYSIEARRMVSLFCTPTMLIFMIFACLSIFSIWLFGGLLW